MIEIDQYVEWSLHELQGSITRWGQRKSDSFQVKVIEWYGFPLFLGIEETKDVSFNVLFFKRNAEIFDQRLIRFVICMEQDAHRSDILKVTLSNLVEIG